MTRKSFADTIRIIGVQARKDISFKGLTMMDYDKISIMPPSSSPYPTIKLTLEYRHNLETPRRKAVIFKLMGCFACGRIAIDKKNSCMEKIQPRALPLTLFQT